MNATTGKYKDRKIYYFMNFIALFVVVGLLYQETLLSSSKFKINPKIFKQGSFSDFSIAALSRGPTKRFQARDPDNYQFEVNAINSYISLVGEEKVILLIDSEDDCPEINSILGNVQCVEIPCWHPDYHKPRQDCLFDAATKHSTTDVVVFINGDVILLRDFADAVGHVQAKHKEFLAVGRRTDLDFNSLEKRAEEFEGDEFILTANTEGTQLSIRKLTIRRNTAW